MSIARRAGDVCCRVRDHLFDLCRLGIRVCFQHLPSLGPRTPLTAVAPIPQHRTSCTPAIDRRPALHRTAQVRQETLQRIVV